MYEKENELSPFFFFKNCVGLAHHKGVDAVAALNKMWFWVIIFFFWNNRAVCEICLSNNEGIIRCRKTGPPGLLGSLCATKWV